MSGSSTRLPSITHWEDFIKLPCITPNDFFFCNQIIFFREQSSWSIPRFPLQLLFMNNQQHCILLTTFYLHTICQRMHKSAQTMDSSPVSTVPALRPPGDHHPPPFQSNNFLKIRPCIFLIHILSFFLSSLCSNFEAVLTFLWPWKGKGKPYVNNSSLSLFG